MDKGLAERLSYREKVDASLKRTGESQVLALGGPDIDPRNRERGNVEQVCEPGCRNGLPIERRRKPSDNVQRIGHG